MADKYHRYEAAVKLSNDRVVVYHNINTGLWKFHRFLCEKYGGAVYWKYYSVRRKENKEIIGKFRNATADKVEPYINVFSRFKPHWAGKGIYLPVPIKKGSSELIRDKFISHKNILHLNSLMMTIPEWLFHKVLEEAKQELLSYYAQKGHSLAPEDLTIGNLMYTHESVTVKGREVEQPEQNFP